MSEEAAARRAWEGVDLDDPRLDDYRHLRDRELRASRGVFVAEGRHLVQRLLASRRFPVRSLLVTPRALHELREAVAAVDAAVPVYVASEDVLRAVVGFDFHRGWLAAAARGDAVAPALLIEPRGRRCLVVVDRLADPENVGAVFRNAMAFGADGVLLSPGAADPLSRKALRASAGAGLTVPFARLSVWPADLAGLRAAGYRVLALSPAGDTDLRDVRVAAAATARIALVVGAEDRGLGDDALASADVRVRITMAEGVDSLNVGTALGIALHHLQSAAGDAPGRRQSQPERLKST